MVSRIYVRPLWWIVARYGFTDQINYEVNRWIGCLDIDCMAEASELDRFVYLVSKFGEFRTYLHYRLRALPSPLRVISKRLWPGEKSLFIAAANIGPGLFVHHGFATGIDAVRIGKDCWINQQVTVGSTAKGKPIIGDRVTIAAGAVVVGPIVIGDDAIIGANATVVTDVPAGAVFVGPRARELRRQDDPLSP